MRGEVYGPRAVPDWRMAAWKRPRLWGETKWKLTAIEPALSPKKGDSVRISAKGRNIFLHPEQRLALVPESVVSGSLLLSSAEEAKDAKPVLNSHEKHSLVHEEVRTIHRA